MRKLKIIARIRLLRRLRWIPWVCSFFIISVAQPAFGHGELLIRIAAVTRQIEAATNNAQLYLERGELHREDKNWPAAALDYDRAAKLNPRLEQVDLCRAKMLEDSGEYAASRELLNKFLGRFPTNGQAFVARARVLVALNERKSAIADFKRALDLLPNPAAEVYFQLAHELAAENQINEALGVLDRGIQKFGPIVLLQQFAIELEMRRNNTGAALSRIDSIIESAARKEIWLTQRGEILIAAHRTPEAEQSFRAALEAIKILPARIQQSPPMMKLQARIQAALTTSTTSP